METGDLLIIAGTVIVSFWAGWKLRGIIFMMVLAENPKKIMEILKKIEEINQVEAKPENPQGVELRIEKHGSVLYAFTADNDEFIAQGPNLKDLLESAHKRFPNRMFFGEIPEGDPAKEIA